mgnify:CR=1 FL=1
MRRLGRVRLILCSIRGWSQLRCSVIITVWMQGLALTGRVWCGRVLFMSTSTLSSMQLENLKGAMYSLASLRDVGFALDDVKLYTGEVPYAQLVGTLVFVPVQGRYVFEVGS